MPNWALAAVTSVKYTEEDARIFEQSLGELSTFSDLFEEIDKQEEMDGAYERLQEIQEVR